MSVNLWNRKPYRTAAQKRVARATAVKATEGRWKGTWRSTAPVSFHPDPRKKPQGAD